MYACMISSPALLHAFRHRTDHWDGRPESKSARDTTQGVEFNSRRHLYLVYCRD